MAINRKFLLVAIVLSGIASIQLTCKKGGIGCVNNQYSFSMSVRAYPDSDSINVFDTIWIEIDQPTIFVDGSSGNTVNFNGAANLGTTIAFGEIISASQIRDAANDFNFVLLQGSEVPSINSIRFREYLFAENTGYYKFKLGVIPKRIGVFRFSLENAANVYKINFDCTYASFRYDFVNTDQHFYLFPGGAGTPAGGGAYYFKVK